MSTETFNFNSFIKDSINTLVKPKEYFASLQVEGGLGEPIIKALIYGAIAGVFKFLWGILHVGAVTGGLLGGSIGFMAFIWSIIGALIGLFIGAVIVLIVSAICSGSTDYTANARVTASLMVLMPISAFFSFLTGFNFYLGFIINLIIQLYSLYLLYWAVTGSLKAKESTAKIISIVLGAILVIFLLVGMGARKAANKFLDDYNIDTDKIEQGMKDMQKDMEKALEDMQEEAGDTVD
jgi:hypothetical protein